MDSSDSLFAHFRPGKEENIPAQSYRTIDDFSEQTKNVKTSNRSSVAFLRRALSNVRSHAMAAMTHAVTNDDDALEGLVDSRATHVTDPGRASSRSLNRDPSVHEVRHEKAAE